jgi:hypothetical protein
MAAVSTCIGSSRPNFVFEAGIEPERPQCLLSWRYGRAGAARPSDVKYSNRKIAYAGIDAAPSRAQHVRDSHGAKDVQYFPRYAAVASNARRSTRKVRPAYKSVPVERADRIFAQLAELENTAGLDRRRWDEKGQ